MEYRKLISRNLRRHTLRTVLTVFGLTVALLSFCLIRTMVDAWYAGVKTSAKNRLVVRNRVSLVFYLPVSYRNQIAQVPGVAKVGKANWFGGVYKDERYRVAQFAVDENYLDVYPELLVDAGERREFDADRQAALIGEEVAQKYGIKKGDKIQLKGTIFAGMWELNVKGIFRAREPNTRTHTLLFHWDYLNERNRAEILRQPDHAGFFVVQLENGADPAKVSKLIDEKFANSYAETLSETETAFQQSFVSMSSTIILALNIVSMVVLVVMLLVLANTMMMSARERYREYAIIRALGFRGTTLWKLIVGEALSISAMGFVLLSVVLAVLFSIPPAVILGDLLQFFPVFRLNPQTVAISLLIAAGIGILAGSGPAAAIARTKVVDGLRRMG